MTLKDWAQDTFLRSVKTAAQSAVALMAADQAGLTQISWEHVGDVAGLAFVVCVLHNISVLQLRTPAAAPVVVQNITALPAATFPGSLANDGPDTSAGTAAP